MGFNESQVIRDGRGRFAEKPGGHVMMNTMLGARGNTPEHASLGVTPYKASAGKDLTTTSDPYLSSYRHSPRYAQFNKALRRRASMLGVSIRKSEDAAGVWEGHLEPSSAVEVEGSPAALRQLARDMRDQFNQEAVMLTTDDPDGPDAVEVIRGIDPDEALKTMTAVGLTGGRIVGADTLEIADPGRRSEGKARELARRVGGFFDVRPARVEFI